MVHILRLVTVHPALVHLAIGLVALPPAAYALALWSGSERWTFAGDVSLAAAAFSALAAFAFGLVSNSVLDWPGGIGSWRWIHLGLAAAATALLAGTAAARLRSLGRTPAAGKGLFAASLLSAALVGAAGWVGGEVLVYRAGMAVEAAGQGALAPPLSSGEGPLSGVLDAMGRLRPRWASARTALSVMLVERPSDGAFSSMAADAGRMASLARGLATLQDDRLGPDLRRMALDLEKASLSLEGSANSGDLAATVRGSEAATESCARCHLEHRWKRK